MTPEHSDDNVIPALRRLLADTFILYLKTLNFHWNVTGPLFGSLHELFRAQYVHLAATADTLAERLRALGAKVPASFDIFAKDSALASVDGAENADAMLRALAADHRVAARSARAVIAAADDDHATADIATEYLETLDKNRWMLESYLA